jgi:hypothetical protein
MRVELSGVPADVAIASGAKGERAALIAEWRGDDPRSGVEMSGTQEVRPEEEVELDWMPFPLPCCCPRATSLLLLSSLSVSSLCRSGSDGAGVRSSEDPTVLILKAALTPAGHNHHTSCVTNV